MRRASLVVGVGLLTVVVVFALVGLFWLPDDPVKVQAQQALLRAGGDHLLGTDGYGRDILARLMVGAAVACWSASSRWPSGRSWAFRWASGRA